MAHHLQYVEGCKWAAAIYADIARNYAKSEVEAGHVIWGHVQTATSQCTSKTMTKVSSMSSEGFVKNERWSGGGAKKDERLGLTCSNRMEKLLGVASAPPPSESTGDLSELKEEDVWGSLEGVGRSCGSGDAVMQYNSSSFRIGLSSLSSVSILEPNGMMIPQIRTSERYKTNMHQSAPVNVPDWSRIVGMEDGRNDILLFDDESMVPPHEYVARQQAMNAASVFAGVGTTLKGRDLSRVRNAVWSQTGFLG